MPALSFKKQFVPFVENGSKAHSIRAHRARTFKVGDTISLFYGMRTKQCRLLGRAACVKVSAFRLERARVWIDGTELSRDEKDLLAWTDGFRHPALNEREGLGYGGCFDLMLSFWAKEHGDTLFEGQIIHWDWRHRCMCDHKGYCSLCAAAKKVNRGVRKNA